MIIVSHRVNTNDKLIGTPTHFGVEIDVRSNGGKLIVQHEPCIDGEKFESWIANFHHALLILNVKEEGLEKKLLACMKEYSIDNFFFLDQSFPFLIKTMKSGEKRSAVRVSEYESINTALSLSGKIEWVWIDSFSRFPLSDKEIGDLKDAGFRLCFVSPEVVGRIDLEEYDTFRSHVMSIAGTDDAVCTKRIEMW